MPTQKERASFKAKLKEVMTDTGMTEERAEHHAGELSQAFADWAERNSIGAKIERGEIVIDPDADD